MHDVHVHLAHHEERVRAALSTSRAGQAARLRRLERRTRRAAARERLARLVLS